MMKMAAIKKVTCVILALVIMFSFAGCWDYRGINELDIVSGIAVDKNDDGTFHLTFEVVDVEAYKEKGMRASIVEADGNTIFDAMRNAKTTQENKLYYGNTNLVVVSSSIAKEDGLNSIIDLFLRGGECRESTDVIISHEQSAKDIFTKNDPENQPVSYTINRIIEQDQTITASTRSMPLYKIYNTLNTEGESLVIPTFHYTEVNEKPTIQVDGVAVFNEDKLAGFLSPEDTHYYLFTINEMKGGLFTFNIEEDSNNLNPDNITLEVAKSDTKTSFNYESNKVTMTLKINVEAYLVEVDYSADLMDEQEIKKIKTSAEKKLTQNIQNVIQKIRTEYSSDIFGFGCFIYKRNYNLWKQIGKDWNTLFQNMEKKVEPEI